MLAITKEELKIPNAGKYEYPFFDVDSVLKKLRDIRETAGTDTVKRETVAETLHMALKGGGFTYLMAAMEKYGFIQTGGGNVVITERGKIALYGEPREIEQAKSQAVLSVEMFRDIANQFGKNPQVEQVKIFLREKANVDIAKAQKIAPKVATIYKKVSKYITSAEKLAPPTHEPKVEVPSFGRGERVTMVQPEPSVVELLKIQFGDVYIQIPSDAKSLDSIKLAKDALEFMEQRLLKEVKEKKKE